MLSPRSSGKVDELLERKLRLAAQATATTELAARLRELRAWQAGRLAQTYADLQRDPLSAAAVSFFLTDLYGPQDFTRRDADLMRAWRLLRRTLPRPALEILALAIELAVLSEDLDQAVAERLPDGAIGGEAYASAYRAAGRAADRRRQIELIVEIGARLARAVRIPLIGVALRAARGPAQLAGFGVLQDFLERGFAAFSRMPSAQPLLDAIDRRETALMDALLGDDASARRTGGSAAGGPLRERDGRMGNT